MISFLGKIWRERGKFSSEKSLFKNLLDVRNRSEADFTDATFEKLFDPFLFCDMERSVSRIQNALEKGEKILIFGDYDVDGMSGVAQLFLTMKMLGANVSYRLPRREEGYGLSSHIAEEIKNSGTSLVLTTDCGISNRREIEALQKENIDVIITDHHSLKEELPPAYAILHPLLESELFPDKHITGSGVAFFLCYGLLLRVYGKEKSRRSLEQLLELAVLGTIADCGILQGQNRIITLLGLEHLKNTKNPGLRSLLDMSKSAADSLNAEQIAFYLAPRLNAAGRLSDPHISLELLLGNHTRALELETLNHRRQDLVEIFLEKAEKMIDGRGQNLPAFLLKSEEWPSGILGLLAGKICEKYGKPTVVVEVRQQKMIGSCRGPDDFHFSKALKNVAEENPDLFLGFGGHAIAAGFSISSEKYSLFESAFLRYVEKSRGTEEILQHIDFDFSHHEKIHAEEILELENCAPFGTGNPNPLFHFPKMKIKNSKACGNGNKHLSLFLENQHGQRFSGIFFGQGALLDRLSQDKEIDILASPEVREWNGERRVQMKIVDIRGNF
ncbi:single-stranded-DNA-specific exonuclease RecJ [Candidatus Peregrinibacteria bacterium]|nr:single-stranded-DNA-specific exonuclease RecJ [Candidatus Peregrinibacteria bacterium]